MTCDPIGYSDGSNVYAFTRNNPANYVDPWGLCRERKDAWFDQIFGEGALARFDRELDAYTFDVMFDCAVGWSCPTQLGGGTTIITKTGQRVVGEVVSGFKKHGIDRVVERGVTPKIILDTLRNPRSVKEVIDKHGREAIKYIGDQAVIVLNKFKEVVTVWLKSGG